MQLTFAAPARKYSKDVREQPAKHARPRVTFGGWYCIGDYGGLKEGGTRYGTIFYGNGV